MSIDNNHEVTRTLHEDIIYPAHEKRTESELFAKNKRILVHEKDTPCWICGSKENREVHHLIEWSLFPAIDPQKMLEILRFFDFYGYTKADPNTIPETPDDIRNLLVLCETHHRGVDNGVHDLTLPIWLALKVKKDDINITEQVEVVKKADKKLSK